MFWSHHGTCGGCRRPDGSYYCSLRVLRTLSTFATTYVFFSHPCAEKTARRRKASKFCSHGLWYEHDCCGCRHYLYCSLLTDNLVRTRPLRALEEGMGLHSHRLKRKNIMGLCCLVLVGWFIVLLVYVSDAAA